MRDGFVKAAVSSPELRVADCRFNREQLAAAAGRMAKEGVKLLVFPEYSLTGYTCNDLFLQDTLLDGALQGLREYRGGGCLPGNGLRPCTKEPCAELWGIL